MSHMGPALNSQLAPGSPVRFTSGRYNGFTGTIRWMGDSWAQIVILYDNRPAEVLEELRHCDLLRANHPEQVT